MNIVSDAVAQVRRARALATTPQVDGFMELVVTLVGAQRERWAEEDSFKSAPQWAALLARDGAKIAGELGRGNEDQARWYAASAAAVLCNWHAAMDADTADETGGA